MMSGWHFDGLELLGGVGYIFLFVRHLLMWAASERERKPILPLGFWYLSITGASALLLYGWYLKRPAVFLPNVVAIMIYLRNLQLELRHRKHRQWRQKMNFDSWDFPWPSVSIIVPVHNEEKGLAATLDALCRQQYGGEKPEIIVALNGCTDGSAEIARRYPVTVIESEKAGMSFGKNFGVQASSGELLFLIDADSHLPPDGVQTIVEAMYGKEKCLATVRSAPRRGGAVVRACFMISNRYAQKQRVQSVGGSMALTRNLFDELGGLDEKLPQGTSSDFFMRALQAGAEFVYVDQTVSVTSIRRFEKVGIVWQMLSWRRNHQALAAGEHKKLHDKPYDVVR